jgi:hypothetical protein
MRSVLPRTYCFQGKESVTSLCHVDVFEDISLSNYVCMLSFGSSVTCPPCGNFLDLSILTTGDLHKSGSFSLCSILNWSLHPSSAQIFSGLARPHTR